MTEALSRARSARDLPKLCQAHSRAVPVAGGGRPVGTWRFDREAGDKNLFRASPDFDRTVLDLGESLRRLVNQSEDAREGPAAFREKRPYEFKGR